MATQASEEGRRVKAGQWLGQHAAGLDEDGIVWVSERFITGGATSQQVRRHLCQKQRQSMSLSVRGLVAMLHWRQRNGTPMECFKGAEGQKEAPSVSCEPTTLQAMRHEL